MSQGQTIPSMQKWQKRVYKKVHEDLGITRDEWNAIRKTVITRDKYTCQRCDTKFKALKYLTVHHMLPRAEGGGNEITNLISLCNECHDYVEIEELRTKAEIIGSYEDEIGNDIPGVAVLDDTPEDDWRPDWHKHVYGGVRKS